MLRDNLAGLIEPMLSSAGTYSLALCTHPNESSDDRPQNALKIPARQGGIYTLPENVASPFHAEPAQPVIRVTFVLHIISFSFPKSVENRFFQSDATD
jgi:hypothetical protein